MFKIITKENQLADFLAKQNLYSKPDSLYNINKPTEFGQRIYVAKLGYQPKIVNKYEQIQTVYQKQFYFLIFNVKPALARIYIMRYFEKQTGHDFTEIVKCQVPDTKQVQYVPYAELDLHNLNQTNGLRDTLPSGQKVCIITGFNKQIGQFNTETWQLKLNIKADIGFILRKLNENYWQKCQRLESQYTPD